ncbi:MAG: FliI/YscN family ATPase [SAR324 cluster bacterium]|nr:FliI/YscN family ATPase [SAR324 cluster bacterium]
MAAIPQQKPRYSHLDEYNRDMQRFAEVQVEGRVTDMIGQMIEAYNPGCAIGSLCHIFNPDTQSEVLAEVVGFRKDKILLMPLKNLLGVNPKCRVIPERRPPVVPVGDDLLGRVIDPLFVPLDDLDPINFSDEVPLYNDPPNPLVRRRIEQSLDVGIKAINGCLSCGRGQRVGILAGSGVGKSVLLGMMAQNTDADVNVIALIGERGREVQDFIHRDLGEEGMRRSVMVVATSDQPPLLRMRGAFVATAIAEYFCSKGKSVLLMMDSVTRFAMAQREVGLAAGEPPTTKGYPPSVFAMLPKLLERAGTSSTEGTITGFYTVLVEGDDANDPIADSIRAIVDGHIVLSRELATRGHYPAIDIAASASRVMVDVASITHQSLALTLRRTLATYREAEDLINIGAYVQGSNTEIDYALSKYQDIQSFLRQDINERSTLLEAEAALQQIFSDSIPE